MRLSRLHIAGFKSFPDRAELGFDDGVTAIVGPNGCGKSNVVDAITWVLGEQSAKSLRGERMEDVIFNGSDARKPTSAAEVRLKLTDVTQVAMPLGEADRAPGDRPALTRDVEIGRRLYRSGESEYLINGEICRLRDVHDLLMDSGLGVKAYAVIEQGKIGQILSSRPAERRMLIEEAAGVTKYKSRRRSAELKLEAAEQNLTRVDDIVFEVEKQRSALKRQASRARRYKRLREELRRWEQVQFAHRYQALARELEVADARLVDARARDAAAAAHVAERETSLEAARLAVAEAEAAATAGREQAHTRELEVGRRQQQIQFDRQQIEDLAKHAEALSIELADLSARRGPAAEALAAQQAAAVAAEQAREEARHEVAADVEAHDRALAAVQVVEKDADTIRAAVLGSGATLSALRQARESALNVRDRVAAELDRLDVEARELAADAARTAEARARSDRELVETRDLYDQAAAARQDAERELDRVKLERDDMTRAHAAAARDLAGADARLRSLEELDASRATFGDAARALLAGADRDLRHHGAVADHVAVERSFERAVEALLGDLLQYVIVDTAADAEQGIGALAAHSAGRGGFLVLDAHHPDDSREAGLVVPPGARTLTDLVRVTGPHADAITRLIGRALVVSSFDEARALSAIVSVPIATVGGDVFLGGGRVEGGSRQDARGILETRGEISALAAEVAAASAGLAEHARRLAAGQDAVAAAEQQLASAVAAQHDREKAIIALDADVRRSADEHARVAQRLSVVQTDRARATDEHKAAESRREGASVAIESHESEQRVAESRLGAVFADLQAARDAADTCLRRMTGSRTREATLIERASALLLDVTRLTDAARDLETRIATRSAEIERTVTRRRELSDAIADHERQLDEDIRQLDVLKAELAQTDDRLHERRADFAAREQAIRGARHALDAARAVVAELEVLHARASADLAHLESACLDAIGAGLADVMIEVARMDAAGELVPPSARTINAAEDEDGGEDVPAALDTDPAAPAAITPDAVIALLRGRIDRLGPVNMMAIEQFDELESRHAFLTAQRTDLVDSIAQTGEAIRRIDATTRERFAEAFACVNQNFEKTFTTLFGGGRAGLVLIDQENDVESGIDIIAQPPGKRLQNVQLLSGGEKALTAMALMFAIFTYRPSPFCLLDEIDAPLDDANIGRFIEMLQGMQAHTQFILITHNRKTMEIANRLYGVTMEEPGVSRLISVQMN